MSETESTEIVETSVSTEVVEAPIPTSGKPVKGVRQIPNPPREKKTVVFDPSTKKGKYQLRNKEKGVRSKLQSLDDRERNLRAQMEELSDENEKVNIAIDLEKIDIERQRQLGLLEKVRDRWDASRNPEVVAKNARLTAESKAKRKQTRRERKEAGK